MFAICWLVVPVMTYGVALLPDWLMITIGLDGMPVPMVFAAVKAL